MKRWPAQRGLAADTFRVLLTAAVATSAGCDALDSYEAARASLPADQFAQIDGQWVHFVRQGAGDPVVLIHGFGGSTFLWRNVLLELASAFDVLALDLNGFGYTERPASPEAYSLRGQSELVLALLDDRGLSSVSVVGHSYGAGVALTLAVEAPERVRSVIVVDGVANGGVTRFPPIPPLLRPFLPWWVANYFLTSDQIGGTLRLIVHDDAFVTDEIVAGYLAPLRLEGLDFALAGIIAQLDERAAGVDPADVRQPVLVIWGEHDPVFALESGQALADALPDARLVIFENSGHVPIEEEPTRFGETVAAFLSE